MRYDERLANEVSALEVRKTRNKFAFHEEVLRQSDLVVEGGVLNRIHEPLSIAT